VGLTGLREGPYAGSVISVGLAGGLADDAEPGTVVVPDEVVRGEVRVRCDERWAGRLAAAARALGYPLLRGPLLSSDVMVTGYDRGRWAGLGFAAVDMETGQLAERASHIAAVRVVLDAPGREISPRWRHPLIALLDPSCWGEAVWLARHAPPYARRAAAVLASALQRDVDPEV
jgi:nucleoside phosphorylase